MSDVADIFYLIPNIYKHKELKLIFGSTRSGRIYQTPYCKNGTVLSSQRNRICQKVDMGRVSNSNSMFDELVQLTQLVLVNLTNAV